MIGSFHQLFDSKNSGVFKKNSQKIRLRKKFLNDKLKAKGGFYNALDTATEDREQKMETLCPV